MIWVYEKDVDVADQRLTSQVHEIVGRINGRYGSVTFVPIHHLVSSVCILCFPCSTTSRTCFTDYVCSGLVIYELE